MPVLISSAILAFVLGVLFTIFIGPRILQAILRRQIVSQLKGASPTIPFHLHTPASFHEVLSEGVPWLASLLDQDTAGRALGTLQAKHPMTSSRPLGLADHEAIVWQIENSILAKVLADAHVDYAALLRSCEQTGALDKEIKPVSHYGSRPSAGFRLPGEHEPLAGVLLSWPINYPSRWERHAELADQVRVAGAKPVILVPSAAWQALVDAYLKARAPAAQPKILQISTDDVWIRDFGPHFVKTPEGGHAIIATPYVPIAQNYQKYDNNAQIELARAFNLPFYRFPLIVEGGNLVTDGAGTLVMTDAVLHYNPELTPSDLSAAFKGWFGIDRLLLFPALKGELTGHIDMIVKFADPSRVLVADVPKGHPWKDDLNYIAQKLGETRAHAGTGALYAVHRIMMAPTQAHSPRVWSYINSLTVNDSIIMPLFDEASDAAAIGVYRKLGFSHVVGIDYRDFPLGSVHCQTKEIPEGVAL
jgi:agmatine deiminase